MRTAEKSGTDKYDRARMVTQSGCPGNAKLRLWWFFESSPRELRDASIDGGVLNLPRLCRGLRFFESGFLSAEHAINGHPVVDWFVVCVPG